MKTIRLRRRHVRSWISDTRIKVVHLVRDPRAVYMSMTRQTYTFGETIANFGNYCSNLEQDLDLAEDLPDNRYYVMERTKCTKDDNPNYFLI